MAALCMVMQNDGLEKKVFAYVVGGRNEEMQKMCSNDCMILKNVAKPLLVVCVTVLEAALWEPGLEHFFKMAFYQIKRCPRNLTARCASGPRPHVHSRIRLVMRSRQKFGLMIHTDSEFNKHNIHGLKQRRTCNLLHHIILHAVWDHVSEATAKKYSCVPRLPVAATVH